MMSVTLDEKTHTYTDASGNEYTSVSKVLNSLQNPVDFDRIAFFVGKKRLREANPMQEATNQCIQDEKKKVLAEWAERRDTAANIGTKIHHLIEVYQKTGMVEDEEYGPMVTGINFLFKDYKKVYSEQRVCSPEYMIAGTIDQVCSHTKRTDTTVDLYDFKTNLYNGIEYSSGKYFNDPVAHLDSCSYSRYCLQLSIYGAMMKNDGVKIGKLALIYIPPNNPLAWHEIPVPFMYNDAMAIMKNYRENNSIIKKEIIAYG